MSDSGAASSPTPTTASKPQKRKKAANANKNTGKTTPSPTTQPAIPPTPSSPPSTMAAPTRLLVASIGNPAPYLNTLHSAGHTVLHGLATSLSGSSFQKSRTYGNGLISTVPGFTSSTSLTLWQSPSLMNVSGVALATAWRAFVREHGEEAGLVVVHDELEAGLGRVKVRSGTASAKGHNGLRSVGEQMRGVEYVRIGVGIGRPVSREPEAVARWCLRRMTEGEREAVVGCVGRVEEELRRLVGE